MPTCGIFEVENAEFVSFCGCTDEGLMQLERIESLTIDHPYRMTGACFEHLQRLQSFSTRYCRSIEGNSLQYLSNVVTFEMQSNENIEDRHLSFLKHVKKLCVSSCPNISDVGLKNLPKCLRELDISSNGLITDQGIWFVRQVTSLHIRECGLITDNGISYLVDLVELDILDVPLITDEGLCKLQQLKILLNPFVVNQLTVNILKRLPNLEILQCYIDDLDCFKFFSSLGPKLKKLRIDDFGWEIEHMHLEKLAGLSDNLVDLEIDYPLDDKALDIILRCCPKLRVLVFERTNLTEIGQEQLRQRDLNACKEIKRQVGGFEIDF